MRIGLLILINLGCVAVTSLAESLHTMVVAQAACLFSAGLLIAPDRISDRALTVATTAFPCLLLGTALLIGLTGTGTLADIEATLHASYRPERLDLLTGSGSILGIIAAVLIVGGCGAQAGLVPFQMVSTDVFEEAPASISAVLALTQRAQALIIIGRIGAVMPGFESTWQLILLVLGAASVLISAVLVSRCESLRSLAGHVWLLHGGMVAVGLAIAIGEPAAGTSDGEAAWTRFSAQESVLLLFVTGGVAVCGLLASESFLRLPDRRIEFLDDLAGLGRQNTLAAATVAVPLLTFAAIPPLPGFWGLTFLSANAFVPGIESTDTPVLVPSMLVLLSLFAVVCGMLLVSGRVIYVLSLIYCHEPLRRFAPKGSSLALGGAVTMTAFLVVTGLLPQRLLELIHRL